MKPEASAIRLMSAIRATAKMHEFRAAPEDFLEIPRDPQILFSQAIGILGDAAAAIAENFIDPDRANGRPETWEDDDGSLSELVRFSAIFFDAYLEARLDEDITTEFSLLCSAAYYLSDSVGSAAVIARRSEPPGLELGHGLARVVYALLRNEFYEIDGEFPHAGFASQLLTALRSHFDLSGEAEAVRVLCEALRTETYENGSARELLYSDLITALCARKLRNSSRNLIPPASGLSAELWAETLRKPHFPIELWPAQQRICQAGLLSGRSAIIQMPTSAGKTRATEIIIRAHFLANRSNLSVIVAPFRSLCHDIRSDLSKAFENEDILLDEISDSYLLDIDLEKIFSQNSVLIVTPEKMLYMLRRSPEIAEKIGLIIYDEGHQFEGLGRGPTYELLLASLRMTMPSDAQVILISAVIGNASQVAEWLIHDAGGVLDGKGLAPTARSIAFASWQYERGWLQYVQPQDPDESEFFVPRIIGSLPLAKRTNRERIRVFPERDHPTENSESAEIGLYLGLHLVVNGSVALFCGQKASVTKICSRVSEIFERDVPLESPLLVSDVDEISKLTRLIGVHLGNHSTAANAARLGILGHHANTPHGVRLSIEHAMKEGMAKFVICTSTLAQGVNFPIRYLIITGTQQGAEKIKVRDFHNLMGRAGRAGMYTEGSVIFSSPRIYDERRSEKWRWEVTRDLLDSSKSEPSNSSILQIFDDYNQIAPKLSFSISPEWLDLAFSNVDDLEAIVEQAVEQFPDIKADDFRKFVRGRAKAIQSIAAYLAAYVDFESDLADERIAELATNTLAYHLADDDTKAKLLEVFRVAGRAIEQNSEADFRVMIRRSPLSPPDTIALRDWINSDFESIREAWEDGGLFEIMTSEAVKYVRTKNIKGINDQSLVMPALNGWVSGRTFVDIWRPMDAVDARFGRNKISIEHVVALCEGGFGYELSMILASISDLLGPYNEDISREVAALQKQVKYGISNSAALSFYEAGFSDRVVAQALGEVFPAVTDKPSVRRICSRRRERLEAVLSDFPTYFTGVAAELRAR